MVLRAPDGFAVVVDLTALITCSKPVFVYTDNGAAFFAPEVPFFHQEDLPITKDVYAFLQHFTRLPGLTDAPLVRMS